MLHHDVARLSFSKTYYFVLSWLRWATSHCSLLSTPDLHNKRIPFFSFSIPLQYVSLSSSHSESHHSFVTLSAPWSVSFPRCLSPCSNQCLLWIIHSVHWGLKPFDWQLYSLVCYIINILLLGIVAMVKAITGQRRVSGLMEWLPLWSHTVHLFLLSLHTCFHSILSPFLWFGLSSWRSMLDEWVSGGLLMWLK